MATGITSSICSRRLLANLAAACLLIFLAGCAGGIPKDLEQSLGIVTPQAIDFGELEYYALRSKAAYAPEEEIRRQFPNTTVVKTVEPINVQYFLETDPATKTQTIAVRGTANKLNIRQDVKVILVKDSFVGFLLHTGFRDDAQKVLADLKPHLQKDYAIRVTGHSLGGAIAMIMTVYIYREGYKVERLVTFGQPKVTDDKSNYRYWQTNPDYKKITRVVRENDPVPMVPARPKYGHVGSELILKEGQDYAFLDAYDADRLSIGNLWRRFGDVEIKDHSMDLYLTNIQGKIQNGAQQVAYSKL
jgi:triacylglycerol lipase